MIPLNVTHTCIFNSKIHHRLAFGPTYQVPTDADSHSPPATLQAITPLRHTLSTLILFFASAYKSTFGFQEGPPLHDPLTIAYLSQPEIFKVKRYRVDVELAGTHTVGETVVDSWNYRGLSDDDDNWGVNGKNCLVAQSVDVRLHNLSFCPEYG
jgi:uridine nucleosidase